MALVNMLYVTHQVHIISGRDGSSLRETKEWLRTYGVNYDRITLREEDNEDSNADVKVRYIRKIRAEGLIPVLLLDDWWDTCEAAQLEGVPALRVGNVRVAEPDGGHTFSEVKTALQFVGFDVK